MLKSFVNSFYRGEMKKLTALLTVIVMIATVVNSFNAGALEADCVEVISVTHDTGSDIYGKIYKTRAPFPDRLGLAATEKRG